MRGMWLAVAGLAPFLLVVEGCQGGRDNTIGQLSGTAGIGGASPGGAGGDDGAGPTGAAGGDVAAGAAGTTGTAGATGGAGATGAAGTDGTMPQPSARGCADLFDPTRLTDYGFDISTDELARMDYEFRNRAALDAMGVDYKTYHPIIFHYGSETVTDAMV